MVSAGQAPTALLGRDPELQALDVALAAADSRQPGIVLIDAPPGMGKSALLRSFLARVGDACLLDASGDELETDATYGVVEQLLRAAPASAAGVELPTIEADTPLADPPTVGLGLGRLLTALADEALVVMAIDDLHWADPASSQALSFALRRLRKERVLVVMTVRTALLERMPSALVRLAEGPRGLRLSLAGLTPGDLATLSELHGPGPLSRAASIRLHAHTDGNPLHARGLLEELPAEQLEAGEGASPLPAPASFAALVVERLEHCAADGQRLAAAASVLGHACPLRLAGAVAEVPDLLEALQACINARLLLVGHGPDGKEVRFVHVLARAAVYHHLGPARAAALHTRAAGLVDDEGVALRHRAAAADRDDGLAADAVAFAGRQAERGAWPSAAAALLHASQLSPGRANRDRHLIDAIECRLLAGDAAGVQELLPRLDGVSDGAHLRYLRGRLALVGGDWPAAERLLDEAWAACDVDADPSLGARIAATAALLRLNQARGAETVQWARRAIDLSRGEVMAASEGPLLLIFGLGLSSGADEGLQVARAVLDDPASTSAERVGALAGRGVLHLGRGEAAAAVDDLAAAYDMSLRTGPFHTGQIALFYLADAEYRTGAWDESLHHAQAALAAIDDAEQPWFAPLVHAVAAFPLAARGEWAQAERHVEAADRAATAIGHVGAQVWAATAAARLAHARGDHERVLEILGPVGERVEELGRADLRNPGIQPWALLEAEARLRTGRPCALDIDRFLERRAHQPGNLVEVCRVRGLAADAERDPARAEAAFRSGLEHAGEAVTPFAAALLALDYGTFLRRAGRRRAAADHLAAASATFERLGARPYLARAEQQLRGCGERGSANGHTALRADRHDHRRLTPQERAVVDLVVSGATNREAAAALFVTVKAVEYHLGNVYRKLGIRSRTELAAHIAIAGFDAIPAGNPQTPRATR